jgi:hypothetical protein
MATHIVVTTHKWKIDNFKQRISIVENGGSIFSDVFKLNGNSKAKLLMKVERDREDACRIYLGCNDFGRSQELKLSAKVLLEYAQGEVLLVREKKVIVNNVSNVSPFLLEYSISGMKQLVVNDTWFIRCEIQHEEPISELDESESDNDKKELIAYREFSRKLFALHLDGHSNLTIQVGGKKFKAFKCILMARSDHFHRILSDQNSVEAQTGIIKVENTKPEVIEALLRWTYQVEVDNMEELAMDLYKTADEYKIASLKEKCAEIMMKSLSKENLASRLILAYKHNEEKLKRLILNFLREDYTNLKGLMTSDEWLKLCSEDSEEGKKIESDIFG